MKNLYFLIIAVIMLACSEDNVINPEPEFNSIPGAKYGVQEQFYQGNYLATYTTYYYDGTPNNNINNSYYLNNFGDDNFLKEFYFRNFHPLSYNLGDKELGRIIRIDYANKTQIYNYDYNGFLKSIIDPNDGDTVTYNFISESGKLKSYSEDLPIRYYYVCNYENDKIVALEGHGYNSKITYTSNNLSSWILNGIDTISFEYINENYGIISVYLGKTSSYNSHSYDIKVHRKSNLIDYVEYVFSAPYQDDSFSEYYKFDAQNKLIEKKQDYQVGKDYVVKYKYKEFK